MDKREFENEITAKVNNGIGGGVSPETWADIELVYMNTNLGKIEVADCFWNHTGRWSKLVYAVKCEIEAKGDLAKAQAELKRREYVATRAEEITKEICTAVIDSCHI